MAYQSTHFRRMPLGVSVSDVTKATAQSYASSVPGLPPSIAWAPPNLPKFNPADYDPKKFAENQFNHWASSTMQQSLSDGRAKLAQALGGVALPKLPTLGKSEITDWTTGYIQAHGVPKNIEDGAKMVTSFAHAQAEKAGVAPEWIAAADALMHPPTTVEQGFKMVADVGKAYFEKYGVPLLQNELMSISSNLVMVAQAIPVQFAVAGIEALADGKLSTEEVAGIAVQAAAYACGLLLQSIGIPAPLGALLCGVIAQRLTKVADDVLHSEDADTRARKAAIAALEAQRQTLMTKCASAAQEVWDKSQDYWDKVLALIQSLMDQPEVQKRLIAAGGVRYYGRNTVTLPPGITLPNAWPRDAWQDPGIAQAAVDAEAAAKAAEKNAAAHKTSRDAGYYASLAASARAKANATAAKAKTDAKKPLYQYGFDCVWWEGDLVFDYDPAKAHLRQWLPASTRPYPDGCLYYTRMRPGMGNKGELDPAKWVTQSYWPNPTDIWERCAAASSPSGYSYDPPTFHASMEDEAHCLPTMKNAADWHHNFDAFNSTRTMVVRLTPYSDHKSAVRTKTVTVMPGGMVDGKPSAQAALMFWGAIRPATIWSAYSPSADASDVTQWKAFAYIDPSQIEVYKQAGSLHAQLNLSSDYCDVNEWYAQVQTAAAASALVQQDIIRTVAWQVGAEEAARQAALAKAAADAAAARSTAANAKAAWQKAAAATVAQQAAKAMLAARAVGMARAASGAYSTALKARLSYQSAQASAAFQRKLLAFAGLAVGAFLIWKVAQKHSRK
jgi:hypothetical protein